MQIRNGRPLSGPGLDELDLGIIELLRGNPRAANQELAEKLNVTPATVSARLRRLEESRAMRVVAVTDFSARGYDVLAAVGIKVHGREVAEVARALAELPEVLSVSIMAGPHEIELLVAFRDLQEISTFLLDHVASIEGVAAVTPGVAADIVKFEFNVVPL